MHLKLWYTRMQIQKACRPVNPRRLPPRHVHACHPHSSPPTACHACQSTQGGRLPRRRWLAAPIGVRWQRAARTSRQGTAPGDATSATKDGRGRRRLRRPSLGRPAADRGRAGRMLCRRPSWQQHLGRVHRRSQRPLTTRAASWHGGRTWLLTTRAASWCGGPRCPWSLPTSRLAACAWLQAGVGGACAQPGGGGSQRTRRAAAWPPGAVSIKVGRHQLQRCWRARPPPGVLTAQGAHFCCRGSRSLGLGRQRPLSVSQTGRSLGQQCSCGRGGQVAGGVGGRAGWQAGRSLGQQCCATGGAAVLR